jgi:hypothetical protein
MSSYDITSIILNFFNTKYDKNELSGEKIMSSSNGNNISDNDINELYNTLLLAIEDTKKHDDVTLIDPVEDIINSLTKNVPNLENKDINSINFITDVEFVKKLLKYRVLEIQKNMMYLKNDISLYTRVVTSILNMTSKPNNNENIKSDIERLKKHKTYLHDMLENYYLKNTKFIINSTLNKVEFLREQYTEKIN